MRDRELWRNGSGYVDPTAYEAMRNVLQEDCKMQRGEIWLAKFNNQEREVLVITANTYYTSFVLLREEPTEWDNTELSSNSATTYYYNPCKLSFKPIADYVRLVDEVGAEWMQVILKQVRTALDLCPDDKETDTEQLQAKIDRLATARTEACIELGCKDEQIRELEATLETERTEHAKELQALRDRLAAEEHDHLTALADMQDQIDLVEADKQASLEELTKCTKLHNERMRLEHCGQIDALKAEAQTKLDEQKAQYEAKIQQLRERCITLNAESEVYQREYRDLLRELLAR